MVKGAAQLKRRFERVPEVLRAELAAEMARQADRLVAQMRQIVPVESGDLRDSIGWTFGAAPAGSFTIGSFRGRESRRVRVTIFAGGTEATKRVVNRSTGFAADLAALQEFGTRNMQANPFFFPAWRANRAAARRALGAAFRRAAKKA